MNREQLCKNWGFDEYPFKTLIAEDEKRLDRFFITPPYFDDIVGDVDDPSASFIFGKRGDGKSAIFKMLKSKLTDDSNHKVLTIEYTDFSDWDNNKLSNSSLDDHIKRILGLATDKLVSEIELSPDVIDNFSRDDFGKLQYYILRFIPRSSYSHVEARLNRLLDLKPQARKWLQIGGKGYRRVISYLREKRIEFESIEANDSQIPLIVKSIIMLITPAIPGEKDIKFETMLGVFNKFRDFVLSIGYSSIYILVDKLDETQVTNTEFQFAAKLINPLVSTTGFMEADRVGVKMFLPRGTKGFLELRTDRGTTRDIDISWSRQRLEAMLEKRLQAFSDGKISSLKPFIKPSVLKNFERQVLFYSAMSPRSLLRIIDHIISDLCELEENPSVITETALQIGVAHFYRIRLQEMDAQEYQEKLSELRRDRYFSSISL